MYRVSRLFTHYFLLSCIVGFCMETKGAALYASLFGKQDASSWYQAATKKALEQFEVNSDAIGIKRMNGVGPFVVGSGLFAFSMNNVWYDETLLGKLSEKQRLFAVYHEAAHIALRHHPTQLLYLFGASISTAIAFLKFPMLKESQGLTKSITLLAAIAVSGCGLTKLVKNQERAADLKAAKLLIKLGKDDVVKDHIIWLQDVVNGGHGHDEQVWHYTFDEQLNYLKVLF